MGISDKDYADALKHQRLHERALMQLELEKQKKEAQMAISTSTSLAGLLGGLGSNVGTVHPGAYQNVAQQNAALGASVGIGTGTGGFTVTQPYGQFKALTEQDLRHEGMKAPLSALVDMWTVRWGGEWVGETEFQDDDFWRIALVRLTGANKLEKHNLANQYMSVYRIIE
jgi:hypothetical protein